MNYNDTIIAKATPPGRGGIGILRISGLEAKTVAKTVLGTLPQPRYANYLPFKDVDGSMLEKGIAIWFPSPHSFTGEDVLELHGHGSPVILDILLRRILLLPSIRIAKPGEFSKRAFLNNKLDLIQAEAISDLINATSEKTARFALNSFNGTFSTAINYIIKKIVYLRINIEATIDFPDDNIIRFSGEKIKLALEEIIDDLNMLHAEAYQGNLLCEGIKVVIAGRPNAGKSSLLNALAGRKAAIVTNIEGTTRDILREYILIDGIPLYIIDTAGLRDDAKNEIERIGIKRAWQEIEQADHLLFIVDGTTTKAIDPKEIWPDFISRLPTTLPITVVRNKADITNETLGINISNNDANQSLISLSAKTGSGINDLRNHLKKIIGLDIHTERSFLARRRHLQAIEKSVHHLNQSKDKLINDGFDELLAEELLLSQKSLNEITGEFTSSDLIDKIFSSFCIGK